ncbi:flavodoxin [Spirochaetia bacterium]|nr:flavodoxin [Spirochaetia bacterium]
MENSGGIALVVYSSKTGNTRKVAEGIASGLGERGFSARIVPVEDKPQPAGGEVVLLGFWVDKGSADKKALAYLKSLQGRQIGLFGTLGAYPDSDHAKKSAQKVEELAAKKNTCLGSFMCQGKIDPKLIEMFKKIPAGFPHSMDEERRKRHEEAAKHPNDADIAAAVAACAVMLEKRSPKENS